MKPTKGTTTELPEQCAWALGVMELRCVESKGWGGFWSSQAGSPALRCHVRSTNVATFHVRRVEKGLGSRAPPSNLMVFPDSSMQETLVCILGSGRSAGEVIGYPFHYSGLENSMDCPWGHKELDTTVRLSLSLHESNISTINRFQLPPLDCTTFVNDNLKSPEKAVKSSFVCHLVYTGVYLFLSVLGLCCCKGFSLVAVSRGYFSFNAWALLQWLPLLQSMGLMARGLSGCRSWAPEHRLGSWLERV